MTHYIISSIREGRYFVKAVTMEKPKWNEYYIALHYRIYAKVLERYEQHYAEAPEYPVEGSVTGKIGDEVFGQIQEVFEKLSDEEFNSPVNQNRDNPIIGFRQKVFVPISETDYLLSSKANKKRLEESASTVEPDKKQCGDTCRIDQPYDKEIKAGGVLCGGCGRTRPNTTYVLKQFGVEPESNGGLTEKLTLALKLMKERRHEVAGLGAPIQIITEVLASLNNRLNP